MNKKMVLIIVGLWLGANSVPVAFAADTTAGKAVYDKSCAGCHGGDGKGNPTMAKVLGEKGLNLTTPEVKKLSDDQIFKILAEGAGKMPAQKNLSKDDQKQVLSYIRSLAK
ncbi:MAG: cytochrome c [Deltaproteobacteria bacterium]|nr:cytochrome c [Deltaproteobacteria bacterium]